MKKRDTLQSLASAAALAAGMALLTPAAFAEPATGAAKQPPTMTDADDLSQPPAKANPAAQPAKPSDASKSAGAAGAADAGQATTKEVAIGTPVFSADGKRVGEVKGVKSEASGAVQEIQVTTGGLFGAGAKTVLVPAAKIAKGGKSIQLAMTSDEIGKLPAFADKKS